MLGLPEVSRDSRWSTRLAESRARVCPGLGLSVRMTQAYYPAGETVSARHMSRMGSRRFSWGCPREARRRTG